MNQQVEDPSLYLLSKLSGGEKVQPLEKPFGPRQVGRVDEPEKWGTMGTDPRES